MQKELIEKNPILKLPIEFSRLTEYCKRLEANRNYIVAKQLLRSGTLIGANSLEAQLAESPADFIHKFKIAGKEAEETQYWLLRNTYSKACPDCTRITSKLEDIQRALNKIVATAKRKKPFSSILSYFIF